MVRTVRGGQSGRSQLDVASTTGWPRVLVVAVVALIAGAAVLLNAAAASGRTVYTVRCSAGQKIGDLIGRIGSSAEPVTINIVGTCTEAVAVNRDNVTLVGASPGSGIAAPSGESSALQLTGRHIALRSLRLTGGSPSLAASDGASFVADGVHVTGAVGGPIACCTAAVSLTTSASGRLTDLTIDNSEEAGLILTTGASALVSGSTIDVPLQGVGVYGASLEMTDTTVRHNEMGGVAAVGGTIVLHNVSVDGGDGGVVARDGGSLQADGGLIQHAATGVVASGGTVDVTGIHIANNTGAGVEVSIGGRLIISDAVVDHNAGDGIHISDVSVVSFSPNQIHDNSGWGIYCAGPPAVAMTVGDPGTVSDNVAGQNNCPSA